MFQFLNKQQVSIRLVVNTTNQDNLAKDINWFKNISFNIYKLK